MNIYKRITIIINVFVLVFLFSIYENKANDSGIFGNDFILTFLPNYHNYKHEISLPTSVRRSDSLLIFMTSDRVTSGTIQYFDINGREYNYNFTISQPNEIIVFKESFWDFELQGINNSGRYNVDFSQHESIAPQSFRIRSDENITVFAHSHARLTSEAFNVYPVSALGNRYFVLSYNSHGVGSSTVSWTPSQFAIVAPFDNTEIEIIPSVRTIKNGLQTQNIILNAGDVYLVQAEMSFNMPTNDLTGTEIISNNPIAVFSGHQRAFIPYTGFGSRDILIEQLPPIATWGTNAIITPFNQPSSITNTNANDIFRIIASNNNTRITANGIEVAVLNRGEMAEFDYTEPLVINASSPILTAQYKKSAQSGDNSGSQSDPFMIILPPVEQFGNFYRFANIQANEYDTEIRRWVEIFENQYINVIAPWEARDKVFLDDFLVNPNSFIRINNSDWAYAIIRISDGAHTLYSEYNIGLLVYGYGYANSYGYFGGMQFIQLDVNPPDYKVTIDCFEAQVIVTDSLETDGGIYSIQPDERTVANMEFDIPSFIQGDELVVFTARLIDVFQDGSAIVVARDSARLDTYIPVDIPGFTVALNQTGRIVEIDSEYLLDSYQCIEFSLINYGKYPQTIENVRFNSSSDIFTHNLDLPLLIEPGEETLFNICFNFEEAGEVLSEFFIANDCVERKIIDLKLFFINDELPPRITKKADDCYEEIIITIIDSLRTDFGLEYVEILEEVNCKVKEELLTKDIAIYRVNILDPLQDSFYKIIARDSAGLETVYEGILPGYTLEVSGIESINTDEYLIDFEEVNIGNLVCKELTLSNYGVFEIVLNDIKLESNLYFSIPPGQLPIIIPPKSERNLQVCFIKYDIMDSIVTDKILYTYLCIDKRILLEGEPIAIIYNEDDRCNLPIVIQSESIPFEYDISKVYPNPTSGNSIVNYSIAESGIVKMYITDILGINNFEIFESYLNAGYYETELELENMSTGLYYLIIKSRNKTIFEKIVIQK